MTDKNLRTVDTTKSKDGGQENVISVAELDALKAAAAKAEELESQMADVQKAKDEAETALADVEKAKKEAESKLEDIEKAKAAKELEDTVDVVKGFNLFEEDQVEDVAKFFTQNKGETVNLILTTLEKARESIQEFGETEHGTDLEGKEVDTDKALGDAVSDILKNRKAK